MAKTTQYNIQLKEEISSQVRNLEGKVSSLNTRLGEMQMAGNKAFDAAKVTAYGAVAIAALGQITNFTGRPVKAYGDFEEKQLRLGAQLKVTGNQLGLTAGQVMDLAGALEDATGIDDSKILDAISTMETFQNVTGNIFKEAVGQAGNLSVVFGDIDTAAKQLGSALEDPTNNLDKLKKASIYFTDAEKSQIQTLQESGDLMGAQAIVLDKVKAKFDGLAESVNVGANGSLRNFGNIWDDLMKQMGQSVSGLMSGPMDLLGAKIKELTKNWQSTNDLFLTRSTSDQQIKMFDDISSRSNGLNSVKTPDGMKKILDDLKPRIDALEKSGYNVEQRLEAWKRQLAEAQQYVDNNTFFGVPTLGVAELKNAQAMVDALVKIKNAQMLISQGGSSVAPQGTGNVYHAEALAAEVAALKEKYQKLTDIQVVEADILRIQKALSDKALTPEERTSLNTSLTNAKKTRDDLKNKDVIIGTGGPIPDFTGAAKEAMAGSHLAWTIDLTPKLNQAADEFLAGQEAINQLWAKVPLAEKEAEAYRWAKALESVRDTAVGVFDLMKTGWNEVSSVFKNYSNLQSQETQNHIDQLKASLDDYTSAEDLKIEIAKRNGEDTTQLEIEKANAVYLKKKEIADAEKDAKKKAFEAQKQASIGEALMAGAVAGIDALKLLPNVPLALLMGGVAIATTAANVAMIASQPAPQFAQGGKVFPNGDPMGRVVRVAEREPEWIIPGSKVDEWALAIISQHKKAPQFAQGGKVFPNGDPMGTMLAFPQQFRVGSPNRVPVYSPRPSASQAIKPTIIQIENVYGAVDQAFLDNLNRSQDLRDYRGVS